MIVETSLTESPNELKQQLTDGEYKSSIDVILETVGRVLQKLSWRSMPPASWYCALVIALLISLIGLLSSIITGDLSRYGYRTIVFGGVMLFLNFVITKSVFDRTYVTLQDKLLDALESSTGLTGIQTWLAATSNMKRPILIGLFTVVITQSIGYVIMDVIEAPVDIIMIGVVLIFWGGFTVYYMLLYMILPLRLSRCQFKLHEEDPVSTEVLADWSGMMNYVAYMFAFILAIGTLFSVTLVTFTLETLVFIIPSWLPPYCSLRGQSDGHVPGY